MSTSAYNQVGVDLPDPEPLPEPQPEPEPDRPEWLPSKFKDERAFAESYTNLERRLEDLAREKQEAEEYAQAMAEQMELQEQRFQQPEQQQSYNPIVAEYEQAAIDGNYERMLGLQMYINSQQIDQRLAQHNQVDPAQAQAQADVFARVVD